MGLIQKDALRTTLVSYLGIGLGYVNKGVLFLLINNRANWINQFTFFFGDNLCPILKSWFDIFGLEVFSIYERR